MTTDSNDEIKFFKARCAGIIGGISQGGGDKTGRVSVGLADNYNKLLGDILAVYETLKPHAPAEIDKDSIFADAGYTNASIAELRTNVLQLQSLLEAI